MRCNFDKPENDKLSPSKLVNSAVQEKKVSLATDLSLDMSLATDLCYTNSDDVAGGTASLDSSTVTTERGLIWPTDSRKLLETRSVEISILPQHSVLYDSAACPSVGVVGASTRRVAEERTRIFSQTELNGEKSSLQRFSQPLSQTAKCLLSDRADGVRSETAFVFIKEDSVENSEISSHLTFNPKGYSDSTHETKFAFLRDKVMYLRIWYEDEGKFYQLLKNAVQEEMDVFAQCCHDRYEQLKNEEGGMELIAYAPPLKHNIWRQDHPEVCAFLVDENIRLQTGVFAQFLSCTSPNLPEACSEEIFVTQLHIRARSLSLVFSDMVNKIITSHAVNLPSSEFEDKYVIQCKFQSQAQASSNKDRHRSRAETSISRVEVLHAPVKRSDRMQQKLLEYTTDRNPEWPITGHILDPVRASVVCKGPTQLLQICSWFLDEESSSRVCRFKNRYAEDAEVNDGYRDVSLYVIVTAPSGLKIIGEVQIHVEDSWILKKQMHKLYQIKRAETPDVI